MPCRTPTRPGSWPPPASGCRLCELLAYCLRVWLGGQTRCTDDGQHRPSANAPVPDCGVTLTRGLSIQESSCRQTESNFFACKPSAAKGACAATVTCECGSAHRASLLAIRLRPGQPPGCVARQSILHRAVRAARTPNATLQRLAHIATTPVTNERRHLHRRSTDRKCSGVWPRGDGTSAGCSSMNLF